MQAAGNARHGHDPEIQRRVEEYAVAVATAHMTKRFPCLQVLEQARNNPGFDLLIGDGEHYCKVKGALPRRASLLPGPPGGGLRLFVVPPEPRGLCKKAVNRHGTGHAAFIAG